MLPGDSAFRGRLSVLSQYAVRLRCGRVLLEAIGDSQGEFPVHRSPFCSRQPNTPAHLANQQTPQLSRPPCRLIWSEQQAKFPARRCLAIPLILLCSTDDPVTRGTWRRLGFGFTTPADLAGFGVGPRDLLHMDNTVQARHSQL